jgi:glycerate-2-kinase
MGLFELVLLIIFDELLLGVASDGVDGEEGQNGALASASASASAVAEEVSSGKKTRSKPSMPQFSLLFLLLLAFAMIPIFVSLS